MVRRSPENFGLAGFVAYRNPLLAEAMRVLNLVQQWGAGLPIARRELSANGQQDPEFKVTPQTDLLYGKSAGRRPPPGVTARRVAASTTVTR